MTKFTKEQLISRALIMIRKHREMLEINPDYDGIARDVELFEIALSALTADIDKVSEEIVEQLVDGGTVDNAVTKHCVTFVKNKLSAMIGVC